MVLAATDVRALATRDRILGSALQAIATFGLSRFTMDDVARVAGISRQSVYRYVESKDALVMELVLREEEAFLDGVRRAHADHAELEDAMREAVLFCLRTAREHPLLDRLLAAEPEVLLPYLTTRAGGLIGRARTVLEEIAAERTSADPATIHRIADLAVRAIISYTLTPADDPPEDVATGMARILVSALQTEEVRR
jgi:AcrR family transcriptional regulator